MNRHPSGTIYLALSQHAGRARMNMCACVAAWPRLGMACGVNMPHVRGTRSLTKKMTRPVCGSTGPMRARHCRKGSVPAPEQDRSGAQVNGSRRAKWAPVPNGCTQARHWRRRTVATDRAINRLMPPLRVVEATRMLGRAPATCQAEWRQVGEAKASARRAGPQSAAEAPTERAAELHGLTSALWAAWGGRSGRGLRGFTSELT